MVWGMECPIYRLNYEICVCQTKRPDATFTGSIGRIKFETFVKKYQAIMAQSSIEVLNKDGTTLLF